MIDSVEEAQETITEMEDSEIYKMCLDGSIMLEDDTHYYPPHQVLHEDMKTVQGIRRWTITKLEEAKVVQCYDLTGVKDPVINNRIIALTAKLEFINRVIKYNAAREFMNSVKEKNLSEIDIRRNAAIMILQTKYAKKYRRMSEEEIIEDMQKNGFL